MVYAKNFNGNADTASRLGTTTTGNTSVPVYFKEGSPAAITHINDTFIKYGELANNISATNSLSPIQIATSNLHSANRLQFANPSGIIVEYSTDGGNTWIDYELSDTNKISLVSGLDFEGVYAGKRLSTKASANDKLRITLHAANMNVYTKAHNLLINVSTNGSVSNNTHDFRVDIEKANRGSETNFSTWFTNIILSG